MLPVKVAYFFLIVFPVVHISFVFVLFLSETSRASQQARGDVISTMIVLQHTIFFGSVVNGGVTLPLVVDGEGEAEQVCLDVLLYLWIERILGGVGMLSHEGLDLNVELANTVGRGDVKVLRFGMIGDDFGIVRQLLLAGDCEEHAQKKG